MAATTSVLFSLEPLDEEELVEKDLQARYQSFSALREEKSGTEFYSLLQTKASSSNEKHNDIALGLLYAILIEPAKAKTHYQRLHGIVRDGFKIVIAKLWELSAHIRFAKLKQRTVEQILWIVRELTEQYVTSMPGIYISLLRQIRGGDASNANMWLTDSMLNLLESQRRWVEQSPTIISVSVYTYLRLIPDHAKFAQLRERETKFCVAWLREKFFVCAGVGRELIRALLDVARMPEFEKLWTDLLHKPQIFDPTFSGIQMVLAEPTPRHIFQARITPDMEVKLLHILEKLTRTNYERNLTWFGQQFLATPGAEAIYPDLVRFICGYYHPTNEVLCSPVVPRYVVIGSLLDKIQSPVVAMNVKLALFYDWLFWDGKKDNIMNIEPAMLLVVNSVNSFSWVANILIEFLSFLIEEWQPELSKDTARHVDAAVRILVEKGVTKRSALKEVYQSLVSDVRKPFRTIFGRYAGINVQEDIALPAASPISTLPPTNEPSTGSERESTELSGPDAEIPVVEIYEERPNQTRQSSENQDYGAKDINMDSDFEMELTVDAGGESGESDGRENNKIDVPGLWVFGTSIDTFRQASAEVGVVYESYIKGLVYSDLMGEENNEWDDRLKDAEKKAGEALVEVLDVFTDMEVSPRDLSTAIHDCFNVWTHRPPSIHPNPGLTKIPNETYRDSLNALEYIFDKALSERNRRRVVKTMEERNVNELGQIEKLVEALADNPGCGVGARWLSWVVQHSGISTFSDGLEKSNKKQSIGVGTTAWPDVGAYIDVCGSKDLKYAVTRDLKHLHDYALKYYATLVPVACHSLQCAGDPSFITMTLGIMDPSLAHRISQHLLSNDFSFFLSVEILEQLIGALLDAPAFDQVCAWQLIVSEFGSNAESIEKLLRILKGKLSEEETPIALSGLVAILGTVKPSSALMTEVLTHSENAAESVFCAFQQWARLGYSKELAMGLSEREKSEQSKLGEEEAAVVKRWKAIEASRKPTTKPTTTVTAEIPILKKPTVKKAVAVKGKADAPPPPPRRQRKQPVIISSDSEDD